MVRSEEVGGLVVTLAAAALVVEGALVVALVVTGGLVVVGLVVEGVVVVGGVVVGLSVALGLGVVEGVVEVEETEGAGVTPEEDGA